MIDIIVILCTIVIIFCSGVVVGGGYIKRIMNGKIRKLKVEKFISLYSAKRR